ncbi:MAG TPA: tetratricopeptide repeat-containing diguanylate cyclase [Rudaea sp.]|nr:tetratricopeptide repeat-containing diguanylate cyclase [Rudaea sp.]
MASGRHCAIIVYIVLAEAFGCGTCPAAASDDSAQLIKRADEIKTADNGRFLAIVRELDARRNKLSPVEQNWLRYLEAWQLGYTGEFEAAVPELKAVVDATSDPTLRFRAGVSLVNDEAFVAQYGDAYARLDKLLELQPRVPDKDARMLGYAVAALLYNQAGQYDLGVSYAERWLAEDGGDVSACKAVYLKLDALYRSGKLGTDDALIGSGIAACTKIGEPLFANLIRGFVANVEIAQGRVNDAIALLTTFDADVQRTHSARAGSEFHSILARCYLIEGDLARARKYALSAVEKSIRNEPSKPLVDAYEVLARVCQIQGDYRSALEYHEKYAAADKHYLSDTGAQALAFQMVKQQVIGKKREVDTLSEKNQLLQLQRQVAEKSEESERLYILLLLLVIASITLWTYRVKRSQMRFARMARRDGLTGIVNREHFMDEAKAMLQSFARTRRDLCLIMIDLDNFKNVNDTHGHVAGDGVLRQTVEMCQLHMRSGDLFGRLGGEEFGVMVPDCTLETASQRAEELRQSIESFANAGVEVTVSASFGVATVRLSGYDLRQMLIHADSALYRAKRAGRNRVEVFAEAKVAEALAAAGAATMNPEH